MRYVYNNAEAKGRHIGALNCYKFSMHPFIQGQGQFKEFNKQDASIVIKCSPDTLLNLAVQVVDKLPLPEVYKWTIEDICRWLRRLGLKQYQNTFRENLINGRTLLLLDASALSAMNVRDLEHIKRLTYGIRSLFYFEMTKFGRSLTLYPEFLYELYKLVRIRTGFKYESVRRSDLWREMQLLRKKEPNNLHWEILERWLKFQRDPPILIGELMKLPD